MTELAVPWRILCEVGRQAIFTTGWAGTVLAAVPRLLTGVPANSRTPGALPAFRNELVAGFKQQQRRVMRNPLDGLMRLSGGQGRVPHQRHPVPPGSQHLGRP